MDPRHGGPGGPQNRRGRAGAADLEPAHLACADRLRVVDGDSGVRIAVECHVGDGPGAIAVGPALVVGGEGLLCGGGLLVGAAAPSRCGPRRLALPGVGRLCDCEGGPSTEITSGEAAGYSTAFAVSPDEAKKLTFGAAGNRCRGCSPPGTLSRPSSSRRIGRAVRRR